MNPIVFDIDLFEREEDRDWGNRVLLHLLEVLVEVDERQFRNHPEWPGLYQSGVRYRRERKTEHWKDYRRLLYDGFGDCEDLGSALCAQLRVRSGIKARPHLIWKQISGYWLYHVQVWTPSGIQDPSKVLGMEGAA